MRIFEMLEYLKTQDAVELKKKFETAIEIATLHGIDPSIIHLLRKELESLSFMTSNVKDGVTVSASEKLAGPPKPVAGERVNV